MPVSIVPGETAFVTFSSNYASPGAESITGGGQWTMIASAGAGNGASYTSLWTNGPGGGTAASSLTAFHSVGMYSVCVVQYTNVGAILAGNAVTTTTTSTGAPGISLTTTQGDSLVLAAFGDGLGGPALEADLGTLRETFTEPGNGFSAAIVDTTGPAVAGTVTEEVSLANSVPWSAVAVEVTGAMDPPALCNCSNPIDIAGIVTNGAATNDNASIGLSDTVFANTSTALHLDLPCGAYYLSAIKSSAALSISVHGNTVLYVSGNIQTSGPFEITIDPTAELSLFVGGSITGSAAMALGSTEVPAQTAIYVGGTSGVTTSNTLGVAGALYVPNGPLKSSNTASVSGAVLANGITGSGAITVHYDQGLQAAGAACGVP